MALFYLEKMSMGTRADVAMKMVKVVAWAALYLQAGTLDAQLNVWKLGGSGSAWSGLDTVRVMVDVDSAPGAIQPVYVEPGTNIISLLENWSFLRQPKELGYIDGERPRIWKWNEGNGDPTENGVALIDADSSTYNSSKAEGIEKVFYTIDLGVPMPAHTFGFHTPSGGYRSDGTPLRTDATPAFQISLQEESSDLFGVKGGWPLEKVIGERQENLAYDVRVEFPQQYARFFRWVRKLSIIDEEILRRAGGGGQGNQARALLGTISEFEVYGEGVPRRAIYKTKIVDLGIEQNVGRLFFAATPMRRVGDAFVEVDDAQAGVQVEVRTGRDDDPNIYREYTVTGKEKEVSRQRYENELRTGFERTCASCDYVQRAPRPGMRATILYDSENWTYWSSPIVQSGTPLGLASGSRIQVRITLQSESFADYVRLDSLWVETAPLLVESVLGEVALLDDPQPARGIAEVALGSSVDFTYDLAASFSNGDQRGFDTVFIRTDTRPQFKELWVDGQLTVPAVVEEGDAGLRVQLPRRITRSNNAPLRLVFAAEVFELATTFLGEISDSQAEGLPQPVVGGDANSDVETNGLRVISGTADTPSPLQDIVFSTPVVTPNGDGVHDALDIDYALFGLPESVPVHLRVYGLDGRLQVELPLGEQMAGAHRARWDGRDQLGHLVQPGVYLVSIVVLAEQANGAALRPVGIAY
jgi:hypothetical protein